VQFAELNLISGREINFCTQYALVPTRSLLTTIFYRMLEDASLLTASMQYVILEASSFTNYVRDQGALIEYVENLLITLKPRFRNYWMVALNWEQHRFDDEMLFHREDLSECLNFLRMTYNRVTDDIKHALENCTGVRQK
jgi:hypothetical protein